MVKNKIKNKKNNSTQVKIRLSLLSFLSIIISLILVSIFLTALFYYKANVRSVHDIKFDFNVSDYVGVNVDSDALHLGATKPGGKLSRHLLIKSSKDIKVMIKVFGNDFVYPEENDFIVKENEEKMVKITAKVPDDAEFGRYDGFVRVIARNIN